MRQVSILGVAVGAIVDIVSTNVLTVPVAIYVMIANGVMRLPKDQQQAAMLTAIHSSPTVMVATMVLGGVCSILGGYVAAWLAKRSELLNGGLSAFLCVSLELYALATGESNLPLWLVVILLPVSPAQGVAGGFLRCRRVERSIKPHTALG